MKKIICIVLIILLATMVVSCSSNKQVEHEENIANMPNPIKEYSSLDDINGIADVYIVIPSSIPATNIKYTTISDEAAQVMFMLDNHKWTVRGSRNVTDDLSGIHNESNVFEPGQDTAVYLNDYLIDRIFTEGIQYTIVVQEEQGYDPASYSDLFFKFEDSLKKASDPYGIAGYYQDSTSQRASMEVSKYEDTYEIIVHWPSSNSEETQWYMIGELESNKITYAGEDISTWVFDSEGNGEIIKSTASNNLGYFEIKERKLYWTGAAQEQCKECVFEKVEF